MEHHTAHAASAWYPSGFDEATVLTLDRAGDLRCGARWHADAGGLQLEKELFYPDSFGDLYGRVTQLLGFQANADEHKVQWLSTSGDDRFVAVFDQMISWGSDEWPRIDRSWFDDSRMNLGGFDEKLFETLGIEDGSVVPERLRPHVAAGIQRAVEQAVIRLAGSAKKVCLAGGLGMNALLVAALERDHDVFVQPAAGNAGTAIGAVLHTAASIYGQTATVGLRNLCLGPEYSAEDIKQVLENCKFRFKYLLTSDELIETAVQALNNIISSPGYMAVWSSGRVRSAIAVFSRLPSIHTLRRISTPTSNIASSSASSPRRFRKSLPQSTSKWVLMPGTWQLSVV